MEITELYRKIKLIYEYILEIRAILSKSSRLYISKLFSLGILNQGVRLNISLLLIDYMRIAIPFGS